MTVRSPQRTCIGCRRVAPACELVRIHRRGSTLVVGHGDGRGAWLCADDPVRCLDRAVRRKAVDRALRTGVDHDEVRRLRARLEAG